MLNNNQESTEKTVLYIHPLCINQKLCFKICLFVVTIFIFFKKYDIACENDDMSIFFYEILHFGNMLEI